MSRKESVRWDEKEKDSLAQHVAVLRMTDVDATLTALLNKAQSILPEHRRRNVPSHKCVVGFDVAVRRYVDALVNKPVRSEIQYVKTEPEEAVKAASLGQLLDEMIKRVTDSLTQQLKTIVEAAASRQAKHEPVQSQQHDVEKAKGPVVAVIGMYLPNFRALENRLKTKQSDVRLRYIDTDKSQVVFPMSTDFVVCCGNKLPHTWYDAARNKFGDKCLHVPGRVQQAERAIVAYLSNGGKVHYHRDIIGDMQ